MMAFELNLSYVPPEAPRRSALLVGWATVLGHFVPLVPFFFYQLSLVQAAIIATALSGVMLFGIGVYEARVTAGSIWRSGVRIAVIGLASGLAGLVIGHFVAVL